MNIPLVDLTRQYKSIQSELKKNLEKIYSNGDFVLGKNVEFFENEFASYCGTKYAAGVGSGLDAMLLTLHALNIGKGDEIITVANTFISTILPIIYVGATPVFVDIDPVTKSMNTDLLQDMITPKTRAIIAVHLFGYAVDMDPIKKLIKGRNIALIEDAAQAHGTNYKNKKCGNLADVAIFSFYPGKNLGAYGEAGGVISNNKQLIDTIKILRNVGQKEKYRHTVLGYNSRIDTIQASILRVKLLHLDKWNEKRRQNAALYKKFLPHNIVKPPEDIIGQQNYYVYCIETEKRDALADFLKRKGIATGIHYPIPLHLQECMKDVHYKKKSLLVTEEKAKRILSIPMFAELTQKEIKYICGEISNFFKN
jgi:dTDP-4-amino-4,6-dideoxygalactose transaminase